MSANSAPPSRVHHIGLTVSDLERSVSFYVDHLEFSFGREATVDADWIGRVTGFDGASLRIAFLTHGPVTLELIEYVTPKGRTTVETTTADAGSAHVAIEVSDIDTRFERMRQAGVAFVSCPQLVTSGGWTGYKLAYVLDPDGAVVELVQPANRTS